VLSVISLSLLDTLLYICCDVEILEFMKWQNLLCWLHFR